MTIKTRLSKLEEATANAKPDKQHAEAIARTKAWLAETLATAGWSNRQPLNIPYQNPKQWIDDTFRAITAEVENEH